MAEKILSIQVSWALEKVAVESDTVPAPTIKLNEEDEEDLLGGGWLNDGHFAVVNALLKHQWPQQNGLENTLTITAGYFRSEYTY